MLYYIAMYCSEYAHHFKKKKKQEFAMVDVKTEGKERETDDLKAKLEEDGKLCIHLRQSKSSQVDASARNLWSN